MRDPPQIASTTNTLMLSMVTNVMLNMTTNIIAPPRDEATQEDNHAAAQPAPSGA